jgi:DNA-binding transcriptional ArsR family regulator
MGKELADGVFRALSDPTRRAILDLLREGDRSVSELAEPFAISQPAVSQHLKILRDAGLATPTKQGRRQLYRLNPGPLREAYDWLTHYQRFWTKKLDALGALLDREAARAEGDEEKR